MTSSDQSAAVADAVNRLHKEVLRKALAAGQQSGCEYAKFIITDIRQIILIIDRCKSIIVTYDQAMYATNIITNISQYKIITYDRPM